MTTIGRLRRVRREWVPGRPLAAQPATIAADDAALAAAPRPRVVEYLRRHGHLATSGAATPLEEVIDLLRVAFEVEHALLVQYLYAASSIDPTQPAHRKVANIAIQEMAHMITVENLLLALGGPGSFHIGRDAERGDDAFNPLPLNLEPVSALSLSEYILAEMPAVFPPEKAAVEARVEAMKVQVAASTGLAPHRVGALYAKIYWLLQPTDQPFGSVALTPDPSVGFNPNWHVTAADFRPATEITQHQGDAVEWRGSSGPDMRIHLVNDAASAVAAVASVMAQGEGLGHAEDSHFYEFLETLDQLDAGLISVLSLPTNPFVAGERAGVKPGVAINDSYARLWATLLNVRYTAVVLSIGHALTTPRASPDRAALISVAFDNMMPWLKSLLRHMLGTFLRGRDAASAPTFELLGEETPESLADFWKRQSALLDLEKAVREELRGSPVLSGDVEGDALLSDLELNWDDMRAFVDAHLV